MEKFFSLFLAFVLAFSFAAKAEASKAAATIGYDLQGSGCVALDGGNSFSEVWKNDYFQPYYICGSAVEYNGFLYLSNDPSPNATVLRINIETGEVTEFATEPSWDNGAPTITNDGYLYVCDEQANLCKFNIATGENVWTVKLAEDGNRLASSAVKYFDDKVFVKVANKGLFAVNSDGTVAWCYEDPNCTDGWGGNGVNFSPDGSKVYYKVNGGVIAVNTASGTLAWKADTERGENMNCREPIVGSNGNVFAITRPGNNNGHVIAFDENGEKIWETELDARIGDDGGLAIDLSGDIIYVSYQDGVMALSARYGFPIWRSSIGHVRNCVVPVNDGGLYAVTEGDDGSFLKYLLNGNVIWTYQIQEGSKSNHIRPLVLKNGDVFCGTPDIIACVRPVTVLNNDNLSEAVEVEEGTIKGTNEGATVESGENSQHKCSVWYKFTPEFDGLYRIDNNGSGALSDLDAMLSIYTCSKELSFANLTAIIETQDTTVDEQYELRAIAGKTYYICWDGYDNSQGVFKMHITRLHEGPWYVAPGATGSGFSPEDPTGDLTKAMENVISGQTVNLAPGEYSIADFNNQYDIWGTGMTALCFKTVNVTLKGAGPDKTTIIVPAGYVGIRMETDGASLQNLTVRAYGTEHFVNHYNWHMNGTICACYCFDMSISNVAIYSEMGTDGKALRPFSSYFATRLMVYRMAVETPNCNTPIFFNRGKDCTVSYLTVKCNKANNQPAIYIGDWPWGAGEGYIFNNILVDSAYMPFTVEDNNDVVISDSIFYDCNASDIRDAEVTFNNCKNFVVDENNPELKEFEGFILTATENVNIYKNVGWHTVPEPAFFGLLALAALFLRRK